MWALHYVVRELPHVHTHTCCVSRLYTIEVQRVSPAANTSPTEHDHEHTQREKKARVAHPFKARPHPPTQIYYVWMARTGLNEFISIHTRADGNAPVGYIGQSHSAQSTLRLYCAHSIPTPPALHTRTTTPNCARERVCLI